MKNILIISAISIFSVAACDTTGSGDATQAAGPDWLSVVDRPLVSGDTTLTLTSAGRVEGEGVDGVWEERDGQFCRTLTKPEAVAGTECQVVTLVGDQVTFDNQKGRATTWTVQ